MSNAPFYNNATLTKVTIPESVTCVGLGAFAASGLTDVVIEGQGLVKLQNTCFSFCSSLVNITLPESVKAILAAAFMNSTALVSIVIPASVEVIEGTAKGSVFTGNNTLTNIYCRADAQPTGWEDGWNVNENVTPEFGYKG